MNPISTASAYQSTLSQILAAENSQLTAQQQVSSGQLADSLSGFGANSDAIVAAQSVQTRVTGLVSQLTQTKTALTFQETGLTTLSTVAQQLQTDLTTADGDGSGADLMNQVQALFSQAASALNTQYNGQYVFSGGATTTQPFTASSMSDLTSQANVSSFFQNGSLPQVARIDDNTTIQTGFTASSIGQSLMGVFQSIQSFQEGPDAITSGSTTLTSAQSSFIESTISQLDAVVASTNQTAAQGGDIQNQVATALTTQTTRSDTLKTVLDNMTQADAAQAAVNLTEAQNAFQAAADVFNTLQGMSLLNYMASTVSA